MQIVRKDLVVKREIRMFMRYAVLVTLGITVVQTVLALDCPTQVGRWPYGSAHAVAASGNYAYFSSGTVLVVADVSNPAAPTAVGEAVLPDVIGDVAVSDDYAYIADDHAGPVSYTHLRAHET